MSVNKYEVQKIYDAAKDSVALPAREYADSMDSVFKNEYQLRMFLAGLTSERIEKAIEAVEKNTVGLSPKETVEYLDVFNRMRAEIGEIRTQARTELENMRFVIDALIPNTEDIAPVSPQAPQAIGEEAIVLPISLGEEVFSIPLPEIIENTPVMGATEEKAIKERVIKRKPRIKQAIKPVTKTTTIVPEKQDKKTNIPAESLLSEAPVTEVSPIAPASSENKSVSETKPLQETEGKTVRDYLIGQGFRELSETRYQNGDKDFYIEIHDGKVDFRRSVARIAGSWRLNSEEKKWVAEVAVILASQKKKR